MADKTVDFRPFPGQVFSITGNESDIGCVGELEQSGGYYQRDLAVFLRGRLAPDAVVADVGAYIGVVTALLAGLCPDGHVYAFEPVAENHAHLAGNVAANGLGNVTVERVALFDVDGEIGFEYDDTYPGGSHVGPAGGTVPAARFDTWAQQEGLARLDLVKVDVEGAELAVLDGAAASLRRFRPILVVECNPVALPRFGGSGFAALLRRLRSFAPLVGAIAPGGGVVPVVSGGHLRRLLEQRGVVDLVALPGVPPARLAADWARGLASLAGLLAHHNRWRPPERAFVVEPGGIALRQAVAAVSGPPGEMTEVPVEVANHSRGWLSSAFPHEPVHLSYRWLDGAGSLAVSEGHRTPLPGPLGPGRSVRVGVTVQFPPGPGRYTLVLTLVQEHFAWLDDIDAACTARIPAEVGGAPA